MVVHAKLNTYLCESKLFKRNCVIWSCMTRGCASCTCIAFVIYHGSALSTLLAHCRNRGMGNNSIPYECIELLSCRLTIWWPRVCGLLWANFVPLGEQVPLELGHQRRVSPKNRNFTTISPFSVRTVTDRHILAAYHKKDCWWAFWWYQHWWPWIFRDSGCNTHFKSELRWNHSR